MESIVAIGIVTASHKQMQQFAAVMVDVNPDSHPVFVIMGFQEICATYGLVEE
jgi:ribosomal protein L31